MFLLKGSLSVMRSSSKSILHCSLVCRTKVFWSLNIFIVVGTVGTNPHGLGKLVGLCQARLRDCSWPGSSLSYLSCSFCLITGAIKTPITVCKSDAPETIIGGINKITIMCLMRGDCITDQQMNSFSPSFFFFSSLRFPSTDNSGFEFWFKQRGNDRKQH